MKKVSIILPIYNVEKYLNKCLDSLVNQTLTDLEFICINDGSEDKSLEILEEYAKKDNRFVIVSQENQGQGAARNKGLEIANGEYIVFVDPDDWIKTNMLEELYETFKRTMTEVIEFNYIEYNDYSGKTKTISLKHKLKKNFNYDLNLIPYYNWKNFKNGCLHKLDMHVWARAYSNEFLKKAGAVFAPTKRGEDNLFADIVVLNAEKIQYLDKYLYNYRIRKNSAVNSLPNNNMEIFKNCELLKDYLIKNDFYNDLKDEFQRYQIDVLSWRYKNLNEESVETYEEKCKEILSPEEYKQMLYKAKKSNSFLELIFSIKNEPHLGIKYKVIRILGFKIKFKPKKKVEKALL